MLFSQELKFEIITPLYMGGMHSREANGRDRIRPRAIIGILRYWFRAAMGGICGDDPKVMLELEGALFGRIGHGKEDIEPSRFRLSVMKQPDNPPKDYVQDSLLTYLAYGMAGRLALCPRDEFSLLLVCDGEQAPLILATFWLATTFGGFGARQRRGLGAIEWKNQHWKDEAELQNTVEGIGKGLARVEKLYREYYKIVKGAHPQPTFTEPLPMFDVLHPSYARIMYCNNANTQNGQPFSLASSALEAIRNQLRLPPSPVPLPPRPAEPDFHLGANGFGWRQRVIGDWPQGSKGRFHYYQGKDHNEALRALDDADEKPIQLANMPLGLPIPFRFRRPFVVSPLNAGTEIRRPSPLSFKIVRENTSRFHVLCCLFKSNFLPKSQSGREEIRAVDTGRASWPDIDKTVSFSDPWPTLEQFFDALTGDKLYGSAAQQMGQHP